VKSNLAGGAIVIRGWDGTSIDEISRQSGVAKRFIYARYADKAALFIGAIFRYRIDQIGALEIPDPVLEDVEEGLIAFGQHILDIALTDGQPGFVECFLPNGRAPRAGEVFRSEAHARTLESIAETAGESFYRGDLAQAMVQRA
jgi:AcrR family transcriptional regulator